MKHSEGELYIEYVQRDGTPQIYVWSQCVGTTARGSRCQRMKTVLKGEEAHCQDHGEVWVRRKNREALKQSFTVIKGGLT